MPMFSRLTLRSKLLLLVLLPFLVLGYFTFDKISQQKEKIDDMEVVRAKMNQLEKISELTHELQKERDFAIKFMAYPLMSAENDLRKQLLVTDSVEAHYRAYLIEQKQDTSDFEVLNNFQKIRESVTGYSFGPDQVENEYHQIIDHYLELVASFGSEINTPLTKEEMKAYLALAQAKESLGNIRNMINKALVFGMFQQLEYGMFSGAKGTFEYNLKTFMRHSPEDFRMRFQMDLQGGSMMNTLDIINFCFENKTNDLTEFTASDWWFSATGTINHFHELELFVLSNIKESLTIQENELQTGIDSLYMMLSSVLFGVLVLVSLIAKSITSQLKKIEFASTQLNRGKTDVNVEIKTKDEIGKLAKTFNEMAANANTMAEMARSIGSGDYETQIEKRSEDDVLSDALINMKDNLKAKTSELEKNIHELKEAYQYKSDFLANMSHELRTPLNSMLILSSLLLENKEENLTKEQLDFINVINTSGSNLLDLINDILDLSKIEAGKLEVDLQQIDLFKVLTQVHDLFKPVANENGLSFGVVQSGPVPQFIVSDDLRLGQILKNLISNSMKFTPSGGSVNLTVNYENEELQLAVTDTGIGIPKDKQETIFGAFNQADGSTSRNYGGTGLGLSITASIVDLFGGSISLESEENKGSKFTVSIPLKDQEIKELKSLPEFKTFKKIAETASEKVVEKVPVAEEPKSSEKFTADEVSGKILLVDGDISNVFTLSGVFPNLEIDEAGSKEELFEKELSNYKIIIINKTTIGEDLAQVIHSDLVSQNITALLVGENEQVSSIEDFGALQQYFNH